MSIKFTNKIGYGTMGLTWVPKPVPQEQAFEAIKTAIDNGCDLLVSGEFYGFEPKEHNLDLLQAFFTKYPELRSKVKISVKGGVNMDTHQPTGDKEGISKSINNILKHIDYVDIFECARVDPTVPIEQSIGYIKEFVDLGKIGGISLSEVSAESIRKAAAVYPISCVEVEFSLWATHILTDGVYETCQELNIPILAYSPLGRGFLSGKYKKMSDLKDLGILNHFDRFKNEEYFKHNLALAEKVEAMAAKKNITSSQFALAWILKHKGIVPIPGTGNPERVIENLKSAEIELTDAEFSEINDFLKTFEVKGLRYNEHLEKYLMQ